MRRLLSAVLFAAPLLLPACQGAPAAPMSYDRPGFVTAVEGERLWVFREGSPELAEYRKNGVPSVATTRLGKLPNNMTIKAPDGATIDAYLAAFNR